MPEIILNIPCETYLAQWYVNDAGGSSPVKLRKNSPEQHLLRCLLASKSSAGPATAVKDPADSSLQVIIPYFKGMPPEIYNHISKKGEKVFIDTLRKRFDLQIFNDLAPVLHAVERRDELISAWMEAHGIEHLEKNWFAVEKRLKRMLDRLNTKNRVKNYRIRKNSEKLL